MRIYKSYSDKEKNLIKKFYPNTPTVCICGLLGRPYASVRKIALKNGVKKTDAYLVKQSQKYGFQKNHIPFNKGKKETEYLSQDAISKMRETGFKKNHIPKNAKSVGYEAINAKGYMEIKVIGERKLILKHHYIYQNHFGKIPKGNIVIFKDKNIFNFDIDNLECITKKENVKRNSIVRYPKDLRKLLHKHSKLKRLINAKSKQPRQTE
jgi:hypothetical protein